MYPRSHIPAGCRCLPGYRAHGGLFLWWKEYYPGLQMFWHTRAKPTFPLMYSEIKKENYVVQCHLTFVYCVRWSEHLERCKSYTLWNTHLFSPRSQGAVPFTTLWLNGPFTCVVQVPWLQIHDISRLSNLPTWHLSYTASISHHAIYPNSFWKAGPKSYTVILIISWPAFMYKEAHNKYVD